MIQPDAIHDAARRILRARRKEASSFRWWSASWDIGAGLVVMWEERAWWLETDADSVSITRDQARWLLERAEGVRDG